MLYTYLFAQGMGALHEDPDSESSERTVRSIKTGALQVRIGVLEQLSIFGGVHCGLLTSSYPAIISQLLLV